MFSDSDPKAVLLRGQVLGALYRAPMRGEGATTTARNADVCAKLARIVYGCDARPDQVILLRNMVSELSDGLAVALTPLAMASRC
jgi:hypothetical protein